MLNRAGLRLATASIELDDSAELIDLDEPIVLAREELRPSLVATRERSITQPQALALYRSQLKRRSTVRTAERPGHRAPPWPRGRTEAASERSDGRLGPGRPGRVNRWQSRGAEQPVARLGWTR